jgi:chemotaxis protein MotB
VARKKDAHHGGAWKVAYADFVTAMMALFMVLWISSQDKKILIATSRYFQNPFHAALQATAGVLPFDTNKIAKDEGDEEASGSDTNSNKRIELTFLNSLVKDFYRLLHLDENLADKPIDIQVTSDGLKVTLFDHPTKPVFKPDTAEFTEWGQFLMQNLAWMIERNKFRVVVEGHTRAGVTYPRTDYSAWELSTDCANAARRSLTYYAVAPAQIERVAGYADTRPLPGLAPDAESNQRVTLNLSMVSAKTKDRSASAVADPSLPSPRNASVQPALATTSKLQLLPTDHSPPPP